MSYTEPILDEGAGLILIENPDDFHSLRIEDRFHPREREKARERERERERERGTVSLDVGFSLTEWLSPFALQCPLGVDIKRLTLGNTRPKAYGSRVANLVQYMCRLIYSVEFFFRGTRDLIRLPFDRLDVASSSDRRARVGITFRN